MTTPQKVLAFALSACLVAGCSTATYDEKMAFLKKTAARGVDHYRLLYSQEAHIDKARCERVFEGARLWEEAPRDLSGGGLSPGWNAQIKEYFVDSCVSGKPKPVPGEASIPSQSPSTAPSASPTSTKN